MESRKRTNRKAGKRPTFREIIKLPRIEEKLFMAAVCFGLAALMFLGLGVYGLVLYLSK